MADQDGALTRPEVEGALALAEACDRLPSPYALEDFSAACGQPWLAVDLTGDAPPSAAATKLREALPRFVCPTIAFVPEPEAPAARSLAEAFDVVAGSQEDLALLIENIRRTPLAAAALVQLLRVSEQRTIEHALVAESFAYSTLQAGPEFASWLARQPSLKPVFPEEPVVRVERSGKRLDLVLDHPARRNAYSAAMRDQLCEALQLAVADDSVQEIVLRGNGPAFSSGGDLDEFGLLADPATAHAIRTTRSAARLLAACAPRLRAELHGACVGAGIELPAWADRLVAKEDAYFQLPELSMGLIPGAGGTVSLPRRVGRRRAAWIALAGERIAPDAAERWGLIDEVG